MKMDLYDILIDAEPGDVDLLWGGIPAGEVDEIVVAQIRKKAVAKAEIPKYSGKNRSRIRRLTAAAACLILAVGAAFGTQAYAAEAKEYRAAVAFFQENELNIEGLTRGEVKAVYRDIVTESFTYDKTAEVVADAFGANRIQGFELEQGQPDPADVEALWNYNRLNMGNSSYAPYFPWNNGVRYVAQMDSVYDDIVQQSIVSRFENGSHAWDVTFERLLIHDTCTLSDGVLIWGHTPERYRDEAGLIHSDGQIRGVLAKVSAAGELLWLLQLDSGELPRGSVLAAADNGDGTFGALTSAYDPVTDEHRRFLLTVDAGGQIITQTQVRGTETLSRVKKMLLLDGEYWLIGDIPGEAGTLVRLAADGSAVQTHVFRQDDLCYHFTDMISDGQRVWLSGYTIASDEDDVGALTQAVRERMAAAGTEEIDRGDLTEMTRRYYGAVLLVLDKAEPAPRVFYAIRGSVGRELSADADGSLVWDTERIESAEFLDKYHSHSSIDYVMCATRVFRYTFGADGQSLRREDTGLYQAFGQAQIITRGKYDQ